MNRVERTRRGFVIKPGERVLVVDDITTSGGSVNCNPSGGAIQPEFCWNQRTTLSFTGFEPNVALDASRFAFTPPKGADVVEQ